MPARNVLGEPLEICSFKPMTGFYRDGCCNTGQEDVGSHTVCAVMTAAFLAFSKSRGNDLSTPVPEFGFPGLQPGDRWCLCAPRWQEALEVNAAPRVVLRARSRWRWRPGVMRRTWRRSQRPLIRRTITLGGGMSFEDGMALELETATALADTADFTEGVDAFLNKRAPQWAPG